MCRWKGLARRAAGFSEDGRVRREMAARSERGLRLVSRRAVVVVGLSAIALAASGCSGDSEAEAESPPVTTTEQVETERPGQATVDIAEFRTAIEESFGASGYETSWYGRRPRAWSGRGPGRGSLRFRACLAAIR